MEAQKAATTVPTRKAQRTKPILEGDTSSDTMATMQMRWIRSPDKESGLLKEPLSPFFFSHNVLLIEFTHQLSVV